MANDNMNVNNEATQNENEVPQSTQNEEVKAKKTVTWKLGPLSLELNPTVAKILKIGAGVGAGALAVGLGMKVGSSQTAKKKDIEIMNYQKRNLELTNQLEATTTPLLETVADVVPDVVDEVVETVTD